MIRTQGHRASRFGKTLALVVFGGLAVASVTAPSVHAQTSAQLTPGPVLCAPDRVDLRWAGGLHSFAVELADTAAKRAEGLMFRQDMAADAGMLFVYPGAGRAQFWMKNTLIPLDMLFIDPQGLVLKIHPNAVPGSEAVIDGGDGVQFVLELNGGRAAELGILPGAVLRHPAIGTGALWPCT